MPNKTPIALQDNAPLILDTDKGAGRISIALSKIISYERTPTLFDEEYIKELDKDLKELRELKSVDILLCIDRRNKPVVLTTYQNRIIHALSFAISKELKTSEPIRKKVKDAIQPNNIITRVVDITALTFLIFGSARQRYKEIVIKELFNLSKVRQIQILGSGENKIRITAPLINIGKTVEDLSPDKRNNLDYIEVMFGSVFFYELSNRFTIITPKLFEVWRKSGRATELFSTLLSSLLAVWWYCSQAANKAEETEKKKYETNKISKKELKEAIADARQKAMTYELNVSSIKKKVTTNYDNNSVMKKKFRIDLQNAIDGFKELDLIKDARIQKGTKGQEKVIFVLSETYSSNIKEINSQPLLEIEAESNKPAAF